MKDFLSASPEVTPYFGSTVPTIAPQPMQTFGGSLLEFDTNIVQNKNNNSLPAGDLFDMTLAPTWPQQQQYSRIESTKAFQGTEIGSPTTTDIQSAKIKFANESISRLYQNPSQMGFDSNSYPIIIPSAFASFGDSTKADGMNVTKSDDAWAAVTFPVSNGSSASLPTSLPAAVDVILGSLGHNNIPSTGPAKSTHQVSRAIDPLSDLDAFFLTQL